MRAHTYEKKYRNERKKSTRKERALAAAQQRCIELSTTCSASQTTLDTLQARNLVLSRRNHTLTMRNSRAMKPKKHAVLVEEMSQAGPKMSGPILKLKDKGSFTDESRTMVRDLVATLNVPATSVKGVVQAVAGALGAKVEGVMSSRSVRRMVLEGGVAAEAQLVDEINQAEGSWFDLT